MTAHGTYRSALVFSLMVLSATIALARPGEYSVRAWGLQEGLPESKVQALAQTKDGYLWIGTSGGLVRFDGVRFIVYDSSNAPEIADQSVASLCSTSDGALWVGTEGGGLYRYYQGKFRRFDRSDGLTNLFVRAIHEDSTRRIWVATDREIFRLTQDGKLVRLDASDGSANAGAVAIYQDRTGRIWFSGGSRGTFYWQNERLVHSSTDFKARDFYESSDGTLWLAAAAGLQKFYNGVATAYSPLASSNVRQLAADAAGRLWAGTIGDGIIRVDLATGAQVRFQRELPDSNILALFVDRQQTVWIGTRDGLVRLIENPHRSDIAGDVEHENIGTISQDSSGALWVTTVDGKIFRNSGGVTKPYRIPGASPGFRAASLFADRNDHLWIGSAHGGIGRIKGTSTQFFTVNDGMRSDIVQHFYEDSGGMLWLSTISGLVRWDGSKFHNYYLEDGLAYSNVRITAELRSGPHAGDLLVGTDAGLNRIHKLTIVRDDTLSAVAGDKIWAIHQDQRGGVWIGTRGRGLVRWKDGVFRRLTTRQGLLSNSIFQILQDRGGRFWISSPSGVFSIDEQNLNAAADSPAEHVVALPFDSGDGPRSRQMSGGVQPAGLRSSSGELWFPSVKGLVRINPELARRTNAPVFIESIRADDRELGVGGVITVPAGTERLTIRYTVCNLLGPERVSFRHLLEGTGHDWSLASSYRAAHYTSLRPGRYRFRVLATDASSPESPTAATLDIDWRPRFYEGWWFLPACAVALLTVGVAGVRLYANQTQRRYALLLGERTRLAREMHDTVIQGCVGVSTLLDAAAMAQSSHPAEREVLFDEARVQLRNTIDEAREAVWDLRNTGKQHGLPALLAEFASRVNTQDGLLVETQMHGTAVPLESTVERNLLLVAREAIRNAIAHGRGHRIEVRLYFTFSSVRLEVSDDGMGFDTSAAQRPERAHYGVVGMRERVERLKGAFVIETAPGKGTTVTASIPLDSNGKQDGST